MTIEDMQALCLTSRSMRVLVLPRFIVSSQSNCSEKIHEKTLRQRVKANLSRETLWEKTKHLSVEEMPDAFDRLFKEEERYVRLYLVWTKYEQKYHRISKN